MKKVKVFISLLLCLFLLIPTNVQAKESISLEAEYAYVLDTTSNRELYTKQGSEIIYPASMTKIVTGIVALEAIKDTNKTVIIQDEDLDGLLEANASVAGFYNGEEVTIMDLLCGSLLPSGADASNALARITYGSVDAFVEKMNELCTKLGLSNTHFENPTGLHNDNHYTTCQEMAKLVQYAFSNSNFKKVYGTKEYTSSNGLHTWLNTLYSLSENTGLEYDFVVGAKTGFTDEAQNCVASVIQSQDHEIISILAKDEERYNLLNDLKSIQEYLDGQYKSIPLDPVITQKRFKYHFRKVDVYRQKETNLYLPKGYDEEKIEYKFHYDIKKAAIEENTVVGTYSIFYDGVEIEKGNLLVKEAVKRNILLFALQNIILPILILLIVLLLVRRQMIINRRKKRRKKKQAQRRTK